MESTGNFVDFLQNVSVRLIGTTRAISRLCAEDMDFHRSCDPSLNRVFDQQNARLLALITSILCLPNTESPTLRTGLMEIESIDTEWRSITEKTDILLEAVDTLLDEFLQSFGRTSSEQRDQALIRSNKNRRSEKVSKSMQSQNKMTKPQLFFDDPPRNHECTPFQPLLTSKPHCALGLAQLTENTLIVDETHCGRGSKHPYEKEINAYRYPLSVYTHKEPALPRKFENTSAIYIDDFKGILVMLESLKRSSEIAVDLEHHDSHSYLGIVCLMQISTRGCDWIIDTLKPWRRKLQILNEVFTDPKILKIFHGAHMDIVWLQRDFGLYVVGLFDTYHASRALEYPSASLAYLLKRFMNFHAQKQYQVADWRTRPLPQEMLNYARSDTHFLLQIFDCVKNELIDKSNFSHQICDKISLVLEKSRETALRRYEYPFYDYAYGMGRNGYLNLLQRTAKNIDRQTLTILRRVHQWRDTVARDDDENVNQIMPNHVLIKIAEAKPQTLSLLLSATHSLSSSVQRRISELLHVIQHGIEESGSEPDLQELLLKIDNRRSRTLNRVGHHFSSTSGNLTFETYPEDLPCMCIQLSSFWGLSWSSDHVQTPHKNYLKLSELWKTTSDFSK